MADERISYATSPAAEFHACVGNLAGALRRLKRNGMTHLDISDQSRELLSGLPQALVRKDVSLNFTGTENARVVIVDSEGSFFENDAGALLEKILAAMSLSREQVFICDAPDMECLVSKIRAIGPEMIITLGDRAAHMLLSTDKPVSRLCGRFHTFASTSVMPTYHPEQLLAKPQLKRQVWEDMKQVMEVLGLSAGNGS